MDEINHRLLEQHMQLHGLLVRCFHQLHTRNGPMCAPYSGQGRVLKLLQLKPEIAQRELAELLGIRAQSLGETLSKLERNGYITRTPSETDRRGMIVHLTERGREFLSAGGAVAEQEDMLDGLSAEEKEQLSALLAKLTASLQRKCAREEPPAGCRRHGCPGHMPGFGPGPTEGCGGRRRR